MSTFTRSTCGINVQPYLMLHGSTLSSWTSVWQGIYNTLDTPRMWNTTDIIQAVKQVCVSYRTCSYLFLDRLWTNLICCTSNGDGTQSGDRRWKSAPENRRRFFVPDAPGMKNRRRKQTWQNATWKLRILCIIFIHISGYRNEKNV